MIVSFAAPSKTGKTTFLEQLIPLLVEKKIRVGALKHCHHPLTKSPLVDSNRLERAGATPSIATIGNNLNELLPLFANCSLLLVEGFRSANLPTILLTRGTLDPTWKRPQEIITQLDISNREEALQSVLQMIHTLLFGKSEMIQL